MLSRLMTLFRNYRKATETVVGMNRRNASYVYAHNERRHYPLVDDKILCKELLAKCGVPTAETLDVCQGLFDVERTLGVLREESHFVVKPANSSGGKGIVVVGDRLSAAVGASATTAWQTSGERVVEEDELRMHLGNVVFGAFGHKLEDRALVERKIVPHAFFTDLWDAGVCDLRLILLRGTPLMGMLRVPTKKSGGRANLHQGGIGVGIDLETGRTNRASAKGRSITDHPETGRTLVGGQIPNWRRVLDVARLAATSVPLGYLGVDIVIDQDGEPLVLELNARPGLEIQNVNGASLPEASSIQREDAS